MRKLTGLWIGKTGDENVWYHTAPFALSKLSAHLHIVRYRAPLREIPGVTVHVFQSNGLAGDILSIWKHSVRVMRNHAIDYIVTFNPVPWGSVAWLVSKYRRRPLVLGFIGEDYYKHLLLCRYRRVLLFMARHSDVVTVTGGHMRRHLVASGIPEEKIVVFPHCVPDEWFREDRAPEGALYDLVTVCHLTPRKRVQDMVTALALLRKRGIKLSLCVVGDGPERTALGSLVEEEDLQESITFAGHVEDVRPFLTGARIYVQTSAREGFSLGLVEALAAGLVPVATVAGSEEDHIENGVNGFLISVGRPEELAKRLAVLQDPKVYDAMKAEVQRRRGRYRLATAVKVCDEILAGISARKER